MMEVALYIALLIIGIVPCIKEFIKWLSTKNSKLHIKWHKPTYNELLHTREWKEKRKEILKRDNYKCSWCGCNNNLQVHHKYYLKYPNGIRVKPWQYPNDALITLCDNCHASAHKRYQIKTYYTNYK